MAAEKELHEDEKPLIDERLRQFLDELKPEGAYQTFLVDVTCSGCPPRGA